MNNYPDGKYNNSCSNHLVPKNLDKDLDILKTVISDYAVNMGALKPRDFNADLPILSTLGAQNYDKLDDID